MLEKYGYPFKNKEHSMKVSIYQKSGMTKTVTDYLGITRHSDFECPNKYKFCFTKDFTLKVSRECCNKLKKEPIHRWMKQNNRPITITGMRKEEGGSRQSIKSCTIFADDDCKELKKFHPLLPLNHDFIDEFIKTFNVQLSDIYYPPYNFKRTGCKGCPYNNELQTDLQIMSLYFPNERKQCEMIWGKVYKEYRKIGRLSKDKTLFEV